MTRETHDEAARRLKWEITPSELRAFADAIPTQPLGRFQVDKLPWQEYGRIALAAAADAGCRAMFFQLHHVTGPRRAKDKQAVLAEAVHAVTSLHESIIFNGELKAAAAAFLKTAARHKREVPKPKPGTPGNRVKRAIAEAAAQEWCKATGKPIPRSRPRNHYGKPHPLQEFLDAVSLDIYKCVGGLTTNLVAN